MKPTQEQVDDIKHALGLTGGRIQPYRNHYCAKGDDENMVRMVAAGLMRRGRTIPGGLVNFHVTDEGAAAVGASLSDLQ
jgi:hypothetical protein